MLGHAIEKCWVGVGCTERKRKREGSKPVKDLAEKGLEYLKYISFS
jgi:hypothetical protein